MQLHERLPFRFVRQALPTKIGKKNAGIVAALAVLILFGDTLLPLLGHGIYIVLEFIEQTIETLLEYAFGLSTRSAQILMVWVGLPLLFLWIAHVLRKPLAALRARWAAFKAWVNGDWKPEAWFRVLALIVVLSVTLSFFF